VTSQGGHCGFLDSIAGETWADREILATLARPLQRAARAADHDDPAGMA